MTRYPDPQLRTSCPQDIELCLIDKRIWACVWMHKCVSSSYKLVLYSFTALLAAGLPVQISCLLRCVCSRDDLVLAAIMEPHRTDQHYGSE